MEFLIAGLKKQIELLPSFAMCDEPGWALLQMLERLKEGTAMAARIDSVRAVEGGPRRYRAALQKAIDRLESTIPLWAEIDSIVLSQMTDDQRKKAMERIKEHPKTISVACREAINELTTALKVIEDGEVREVRVK
jgi:hypothetical protein